MAVTVEMRRISTAGKDKKGTAVPSKSEQTSYTKNVIKGNGMYVFIYGTGSNRKSDTKHMSESQAEAYKAKLEK